MMLVLYLVGILFGTESIRQLAIQAAIALFILQITVKSFQDYLERKVKAGKLLMAAATLLGITLVLLLLGLSYLGLVYLQLTPTPGELVNLVLDALK
jgi:hypothetical protein